MNNFELDDSPSPSVTFVGEVSPPPSLLAALNLAIEQCGGEHEEEGGFIVTNGLDYHFIKIRNSNTGTPIAVGLYEADKEEFGTKVLGRWLFNGYKTHSSFHTHPTGCHAYPSSIDLSRLFNGFPINYIWSPSMLELHQFKFAGMVNEAPSWDMSEINVYNCLTLNPNHD